jgi:predicted ArsR family transcriptional regulator
VPDDFDSRVACIGALAEPVRRQLYRYVAAQPEPVGRDQVAAETGVPRHVVKFHLDRLADEGLLEVEFRRLSGRQGPGAGRPAKLYRRAAREVSVTLPERRYDLAGEILADAVEEAARVGGSVREAVARSAAAAGRRIGTRARVEGVIDADASPLDSLAGVLASCGYEPRVQADRLVLANCPFHALAARHLDLVCGMNLDLVAALTEELGHTDVDVRLDPGPGRCCVVLARRG